MEEPSCWIRSMKSSLPIAIPPAPTLMTAVSGSRPCRAACETATNYQCLVLSFVQHNYLIGWKGRVLKKNLEAFPGWSVKGRHEQVQIGSETGHAGNLLGILCTDQRHQQPHTFLIRPHPWTTARMTGMTLDCADGMMQRVVLSNL